MSNVRIEKKLSTNVIPCPLLFALWAFFLRNPKAWPPGAMSGLATGIVACLFLCLTATTACFRS